MTKNNLYTAVDRLGVAEIFHRAEGRVYSAQQGDSINLGNRSGERPGEFNGLNRDGNYHSSQQMG